MIGAPKRTGFAEDGPEPSVETAPAGTRSVELRELDFREGDGIQVRLLWDPKTDATYVMVDDARGAERFGFPVRAGEETEAFTHPFSYAHAAEKEAA